MEVSTKFKFNKKRLITFNARIINLIQTERINALETEESYDYLVFLDTLIDKHKKNCDRYSCFVKGYEQGKRSTY